VRFMTHGTLLLVVVLVSLSAYLRLAHSGIGCADWPSCYGQIGRAPESSQSISARNAYQRIVAEANQPLAWATPLHRLVAGVLGILVLCMTSLAWYRARNRLITTSLLAITVLLALLGVKSGSLHSPAVMMGNLAGGFLMLALVGWMAFAGGHEARHRPDAGRLRVVLALALTVLVLQILLGGLTSANFAATACPTLPDCQGSYLPGKAVFKAMDLGRERTVDPQGRAVGGAERGAIHKAHRMGAVVALLVLLWVVTLAWRRGARYRNLGLLLAVLVVAEFLIGVAATLNRLPIGLAVAHNWLAALLLLCLLKMTVPAVRSK